MWHGDAFVGTLVEQARKIRDQRAQAESAERKKIRLKQSLRDSLGDFERTEADCPITLERVECDGYIRERVELSAVAGLSFGAYVLIPANSSGKLPGVIAVHGHGYGSRQICGMREDGTADAGEPDIYNHFAIQLVKKGFVVIAPDVIGFGERRLKSDLAVDPNARSSCYTLSTHLLMLGKTLTGLRVAEMLGALDYFARRPEVDSNRIGIAGFSGGSLISYVAAALDERIRAALLIGFPNTFQDSIMAVHHCLCNYTPGILTQAELPELMGLISPRPLFLESGDADPIFPAHGFHKAVQEVKRIYGLENAERLIGSDLFPGKHEVSGRYSFDWLKQALGSHPI
ncbi:dienelactone hydrolase [Cohnella cholangitidis]|uniref:Dienelactone hydrolase n=2 Tax=Cohnella cholangitidis TaxID=2598458 RepID=A0A7G5BVG1_9BACL|nr:alpha/beta hydrolase family protein [Cohnella cholangitidis]QMV40945.1 dienelactone hydrolase [Cohnella cholangitidis]